VIKNSQETQTVVVKSTTYYHHNPWYRAVIYEGEEVYLLVPAPIGYETDQLPDGYETVESEGKKYYYHEAAFYQDKAGGGYVVVDNPVGAEVSSIPEDATPHEDESEIELYQYDRSYFSKQTNDAGKAVYRVEPSPPQEEMDEIPGDAVTFVADGETYYYVDYSLYVEYEENGKKGYTNGEPEIGAQLEGLPDGCTTIEEDGRTFYQFDMVFFEEVEDEDGLLFYEVVASPDGAETVTLESG